MLHANEARIMSVKDLNRYIRMKLDGDARMQDVWLRGEISNFTHHSSGHMYFTLKDADSRIKAIMFASHNQKLAFRPKEGTRVIAKGYVTVYERDGQYQFYAQQMQPDGLGSLYLAYEQLKEKLQREGLFDTACKRTIPAFPKAIGVVTSPTGAAVRDIMTTLQRRQPGVPILIMPVLVQGKQAAPSIAEAIRAFNRYGEVDVIIAGRGGGSLEELWAFNEEQVARAIAESAIPVISAVGHETDFTIADFVADLRAPTPTAAAELAVPHIDDVRANMSHLGMRLKQAVRRTLAVQQERLLRAQQSGAMRRPKVLVTERRERLARWSDRLENQSRALVNRKERSLAQLTTRLKDHSPVHQVKLARSKWQAHDKQLRAAMRSNTRRQSMQLQAVMRQLDALSPLKVMSRGYSLVYDEHETKLIRRLEDVQPGDVINVKLADGQLNAQVWSLKGRDEDE